MFLRPKKHRLEFHEVRHRALETPSAHPRRHEREPGAFALSYALMSMGIKGISI